MIVQTSCSELLVDTKIHDPEKALEIFNNLFELVGWESSPPLTLDLLRQMKHYGGEIGLENAMSEEIEEWDKKCVGEPDVLIYDIDGNRTSLEYGYNGYIHTGYRFDSNCNQYDKLCYPMFKVAISNLAGKLLSCDGGSKYGYYEWERNSYADDCD